MLINNIRKSPTCPIRNTIHAPTRGATSAVAWKWKLHIISIHAPTRGATPYGLLTANVRLFQSTLLQEERQCGTKLHQRAFTISIHAPTRGATEKAIGKEIQILFQSTLLQEERRADRADWIYKRPFQSTLLQEERRI